MQPRVSEKKQIAADPVSAIRCDEGERARLFRNRDFNLREIGFLKLESLKNLVGIDVNKEICARVCCRLRGPEPNNQS